MRTAAVLAEAHLGIHLCCGDFRHKHYMEPESLAVCATMASRALDAASRPLSYVHMPGPRERGDDGYFESLETFRRHYAGPAGVATQCGMGRRPSDQSMRELLCINRELALRL